MDDGSVIDCVACPPQYLPDGCTGHARGADPGPAAMGQPCHRRFPRYGSGIQPSGPGHHVAAASLAQRAADLRLALLPLPHHRL